LAGDAGGRVVPSPRSWALRELLRAIAMRSLLLRRITAWPQEIFWPGRDVFEGRLWHQRGCSILAARQQHEAKPKPAVGQGFGRAGWEADQPITCATLPGSPIWQRWLTSCGRGLLLPGTPLYAGIRAHPPAA